MSTTTISFTVERNGVPVDATSVRLSDPTSTYGLRRTDNDAIIVPDGTALVRTGTGTYAYSFVDPAGGLTYQYWVEVIYEGEKLYYERSTTSATAGTSPAGNGTDTTITFVVEVNGSKVDATSVKLSDPDSTFGVRRTDTLEVVVADGADMVRTAVGTYEYSFANPVAGISYQYWVEVVYRGETYHFERLKTPAVPGNLTLDSSNRPRIFSPHMFRSAITIEEGIPAQDTVDALTVMHSVACSGLKARIEASPGGRFADRFGGKEVLSTHRIWTLADTSTVGNGDRIIDNNNRYYTVRYASNEADRDQLWCLHCDKQDT